MTRIGIGITTFVFLFCVQACHADLATGGFSGDMNSSIDFLVQSRQRIVTGEYTSGGLGDYEARLSLTENQQARLAGDILFTGHADPFVAFEMTIENLDVADADVLVNVVIDIVPIMAGLPVVSRLEGEIIDPGGEGVNTTLFHRGFVQSQFQPSLLMGFDDINEPINTAGPFSFEVNSVVPDSLHANDSFDRLLISSQFVIPPGDTFVLRGITSITPIPEPNAVACMGIVGLSAVVFNWFKKRRQSVYAPSDGLKFSQ